MLFQKLNSSSGQTLPVTIMHSKRVRNSKGSKYKSWLLSLAGSILLLIFVWRLDVNLNVVITQILRASPLAVLVAVLLIFPILILKTLRWKVILSEQTTKVSFNQLLIIYALGLGAGSFTPGQAGDAIKAWYLRDYGFSLNKGLLSILLDRLFDLAVLLFLTVITIILLGSLYIDALPYLLILLILFVTGLVFFFIPFLREKLIGLLFHLKPEIMKLPELLIRKRQRNKIQSSNLQYKEILTRFSNCLLLTIITTGIAITRAWFLAVSIGIFLNPIQIIAVSSLATVAGLLPVSIGGIGTRDLVLLALLSNLGYSQEKAVTLSTLLLLLNLFNLVVGLCFWFFWDATVKPDL